MRETGRQIDHICFFCTEFEYTMCPVRKRTYPEIYNRIEHGAGDTIDNFVVIHGRYLKMEPPNHALM
jgi:hypothetical protein